MSEMLIKKIFIKLGENVIKSHDFESYLEDYLFFLKDIKNLNKINAIFYFLKNDYQYKNNNILKDLNITNDQKIIIISLFIFKSLHKSIIINNNETSGFLSSDETLNEIMILFNSLYVFYFKKEILSSEAYSVKGELVKLIKILVVEKIIISKTSFKSNKTLEEWSLNLNVFIAEDYSYLKISTEPFKLVTISENYYLVGNFFTMIKKIFVENIKSEYSFKLNDFNYIENMIKNKIYINLLDLDRIINTLKESGFISEDIEKSVNQGYRAITDNNLKIKEISFEYKKIIWKKIKNKIDSMDTENSEKNFIETKIKIIKEFYIYAINTLGLEENHKNFNKDKLLSFIYKIFKKEFKNAYLKVDFKNIKELLEWKNRFLEYGIELGSDSNQETTKINITKNLKNIKINEKLNHEKISFITYLYMYNKKEIDNFLKKEKKNILNNLINSNNDNLNEKINENSIEFFENENLSVYEMLINFTLKFDIPLKTSLEIYKLKEEIKNLKLENKKKQSNISKSIHIYNIFLLRKYCNKKEIFKKIDNFGNIPIFLMFFFDFRGRFYYDSLISPTTNKFCRFIFNYGVIKEKEIIKISNEIDIIIDKYSSILNETIEYLCIKNNKFIKESVFWILISIGKLKINKSNIKIPLTEFLKIGFELLKNKNSLSDLLDIIEFNYYYEILKSLNEDIIIKRCLLKDATASFFQNLIRILGAKDDMSAEIANLKSNENWYDWYSYIILKWIELEKKNNLYNENIFLYFKRKTLKKTIMTLPYSATFITCFSYFKETIAEEYSIEIEIGDELFETYKRFFNFLNNYMKKQGPYKKSTEEIVIYFKEILNNGEEIIIISRNEDTSNLTYFKTTTKHFDFILKWRNQKIRAIKNYKQIVDIVDIRKTTTALKANLVHFVDALLIRDINTEIFLKEKKYYVSIHDSFMVDFLNTSNFIISTNYCINKNAFKDEMWSTEKNFFSIFVFL